ncbi:MAG TPA: ribonuclease H-like domain-containing protein [Candidatus Polarisedimenticolia bacterium]|nr:ribonuclease H-like domain-containing protein [Candidatus Polarisedimenticolia bacterium]
MPARPAAIRTPGEEDALGRLLGVGVATNHFGEHLAVRNWFSTPEFAEPSSTTLELLSHTRDESVSRKTLSALEDPEKWLFLDTETTGLAGGTGTYAFLIGLAWWDAGGLQVEQFLMRDFAEEHSLLQELSQRLAERPVLVTFNGKSFDWPLLENRFTMTRSIAVPKLAAHLDLLHPARALWKLRLGSVRLVELERHVLDAPRLGWQRDNDVSSALIPQFYFDYLRGGPVEPLAAVVRHNQMDLRGLAALFGKINALLSQQADTEIEIESLDLFGLSRFFQRRGENDRAHSACAQALEIGLPAEFRPKACRELAQMAKRRGEHARAAEIWLEIVADAHDGIHACEQLAIYYERHAKDFYRATEFAQLALVKIRRQHSSSRDPNLTASCVRLEQKFLHRLARLQHQMKTFAGSARPLALSRSGAES